MKDSQPDLSATARRATAEGSAHPERQSRMISSTSTQRTGPCGIFRAASQLLLLGVLALACLLLPSCIDGNEEIRINADGSGTCVATYLVPVAAVAASGGQDKMRSQVEEWAASQDDLRLDALEISEEGDRLRIHAALSFDSALALIDASSPEAMEKLPAAARALAGTLDFRMRGRQVELTRTVSPRAALGSAMLFTSPGELANHRLTYQITLPTAPDSHNATRTVDGGRTLVWDYPLDEAVENSPTMNLVATVPIPWWLWLAAAVLLLAIVWGLIAIVRRLRRKRQPVYPDVPV